MRILFLHLSDLHIKQNEYIEIKKIEKLVDSLNIVQDFDECVVICSGDLAYSGEENEYKKVKILFGSLFSTIRTRLKFNKFIRFLLVPGNHDACFRNVDRNGDTIQQYYKENSIAQHIDNEMSMLNNFYNYSEANHCFKYNKICNKKIISFENYNIQINLINTALFSTLEPNDKQLHYFPNEQLSVLSKNENVNLTITIMHHSTEWFSWECKRNLERTIYTDSSILFLGHDHDLSTKDLNIDNHKSIFISAGGEFSNKDIIGKSEFNAILLNTETNCIDAYAFEWVNEENHNIYKHNKLFSNKLLLQKSNELVPNIFFVNEIKQDEKRKVSKDFTQYFVFPILTGKAKDKYTDKIEISSLDEFMEKVQDKKYLNIVGGDNSGKTALLKILFLYLIDYKMIPLFLNAENIKGKHLNKVIKYTFQEQYSEDPLQYERFRQLRKDQKIAIIDDFDNIKDNVKSEFILILKEQFDYIIIGTKNEQEYNIVENVRKEIDEKNDFYVLKISDFYLNKRHDLIKNICRASNCMNDEDIEKIIEAINGFAKHQLELFDFDPDFIIQFTQYFLQSSDLQNLKNESIFNKIFETNIYNSIIQNADKDFVEETITALEEIAYYIHFNKEDPLSLTDLQRVVEEYNEKYSLRINPKRVVEVALRAKILKYVDSSFSLRFCNKNHLAFFIARCLNRKLNIDGSFKDIQYVLNNMCFGINDNIILFLSYLTSNPQIIMSIYNVAESLMEEWEEFDIDAGNINYLTNIKAQYKIEAPKNGEKGKILELENKIEEERKKELLIECKSLYDYDETEINSYSNKILRALKYTEMLSKALPNFYNILIKENKEKITDGIYKFPNKILLKLLKPVDDDFDELIKDITSFAESIDAKNEQKKPLRESDILNIFHRLTLSMVLSIYNKFAYLSTDRKSIDILNNYALNNSNYKIFNLMVSENYGATEEFSQKAGDLYNETKDKNIKLMVTRIVKKHLVFTENIKFNKRQQLIDKFFGQEERKTILLEANKQK